MLDSDLRFPATVPGEATMLHCLARRGYHAALPCQARLPCCIALPGEATMLHCLRFQSAGLNAFRMKAFSNAHSDGYSSTDTVSTGGPKAKDRRPSAPAVVTC